MRHFWHITWFLIVLLSSIAISHATNIDTTIITIKPPSTLLPLINQSAPGDAIGSIIAWLIGLTAVLTILAVSISGIQMILAIGEEEKFKKARLTMIYAFVGLIITGLAYAVVAFVTNLNLATLI